MVSCEMVSCETDMMMKKSIMSLSVSQSTISLLLLVRWRRDEMTQLSFSKQTIYERHG